MNVTAGSDAVDLYNSASGTWSTAQLSVARYGLAATSVGNVAIFAGGSTCNSSFCQCAVGLLFWLFCARDVCLRRVACSCMRLRCSSDPHLTKITADDEYFSAVDLYNSASGTWSIAQLSVARHGLAATSVGNVAIFAGGYTGNCSLCVVLWRVCIGVVVRG